MLNRYLVGLTDVDNEYKSLFVKLLTECGKYIRHVKTTPESQLVHEELITVLAKLEIKLPIYWCTITRHILIHMHRFVRIFGSFRTFCMLPVERFHVLLKGMLTSSKDILKGIDTCYGTYSLSQDTWRLNSKVWVNDQKASGLSSLVSKFEESHSASDIVLPEKTKQINKNVDLYKLPKDDHQQVMEAWRTTYIPYKKLRERYETYKKNIEAHNKNKKVSQSFKQLDEFSNWVPKDRENTKAERGMQRQNRTVRVHIIFNMYACRINDIFLICMYVCRINVYVYTIYYFYL